MTKLITIVSAPKSIVVVGCAALMLACVVLFPAAPSSTPSASSEGLAAGQRVLSPDEAARALNRSCVDGDRELRASNDRPTICQAQTRYVGLPERDESKFSLAPRP